MMTETQGPRSDPHASHNGHHPPLAPKRPLGPAPARFGEAGLSSGEKHCVKQTISSSAPWSRRPAPDQMARCLGWFSICLGVAEVVGAKPLARWMGVKDQDKLLRVYGAREIATGVAILAQDNPRCHRRWIQARIGGDALDLGTLAHAMGRSRANHGRIAGVIGAVAAVTAADILCAALLSDR